MKENLIHYRTCVCNINYHMVWSVKYRRKILNSGIEEYLKAIVKYLKGITGRKLFERFPEIRNQLWKGELWNHSYYVETIGSVSEENIRRYIEHQSKSY
jgi:putative transposase